MADFLLDEKYGKVLSQLNIVADLNLFSRIEEITRGYETERVLHAGCAAKKHM